MRDVEDGGKERVGRERLGVFLKFIRKRIAVFGFLVNYEMSA